MTTPSTIPLAAALVAALVCSTACNNGGDDAPPADDNADEADDEDDDGDDGPPQPPSVEGAGPAEYPQARQVARLTADQFHASLTVATGQTWQDFDEYAASLGKPDLAEVVDQGRTFSVTFDKFAHDAARSTCRAAVTQDFEGGGQGVIMRHAAPSDRGESALRANLQYLTLRFLSLEVDEDDDRLDPWMTLLKAPPPTDEELTDELMADRWWAVCVGFATHPDFLSY